MNALEKIQDLLEQKQSFLLEAGAGSGKTRTLIDSLKYLLETKSDFLNDSNKSIACITYTNVAVDEINERIDNNPLVFALTIHEFLWYVIKNYQKELKLQILNYNELKSTNPIADLEIKLKNHTVTYSQYGRNFEQGRITHEDVIHFSFELFKRYPKLSMIVANKFPYIFIDEYQDTEKNTVELLLDNLLENNRHMITLGFFGDSMQTIYNNRVGQIVSDKLTVVTKEDNFRCSKQVIDLLNKIRRDLIQNAAGNNSEGSILFINSNNDLNNKGNYEKTVHFLKSKGWEFEIARGKTIKNKVLMLTHRGIADKLQYQNILEVYGFLGRWGRDRLLNKEELFADFILNKIEYLVELFEKKRYGEFIKLLGISDFKINKHEDKKTLNNLMQGLVELRKHKTVKEVLDYVFDKNLLVKPIRIIEFMEKINEEGQENRKEFFESLMSQQYKGFLPLYKFIEENTPFSTKHGVKGAEYDNVLVVIDDSAWNQYRFNDVFANKNIDSSRYKRSLNLLYVCCSRAKNNLVLLSLSEMDGDAMKTINNWFKNNVINVEAI